MERSTGQPAVRRSIRHNRSIDARMLVAHPGQIRRGHKNAHSPIALQHKVAFEGGIELERRVVARPNGPFVHAHGHHIGGKTQLDARPAPLPDVMEDLPGTNAADHREHQRPARLQQAGAFGGDMAQVRHAIQGTEIRIGAVESALAVEALEFMSAHRQRLHGSGRLPSRTISGTGNHLGRPVGGRDAVTSAEPCGLRPGRCRSPDRSIWFRARTSCPTSATFHRACPG